MYEDYNENSYHAKLHIYTCIVLWHLRCLHASKIPILIIRSICWNYRMYYIHTTWQYLCILLTNLIVIKHCLTNHTYSINYLWMEHIVKQNRTTSIGKLCSFIASSCWSPTGIWVLHLTDSCKISTLSKRQDKLLIEMALL